MKKIAMLTLVLSINVFAALPENPATHVIKAAQVLTQQNLSCATVADCTAVAVGARACGGPRGYLVMSKLNVKRDQVNMLASLSTKLEHEYNMENSVMSICVLASYPELTCEANKCSKL